MNSTRPCPGTLMLSGLLLLWGCTPRFSKESSPDTGRADTSPLETGSSETGWPDTGPHDTAPETVDADGDGFPSTVDCHDDDPALYPGAQSDHQGILMAYVCNGTFTMGSPEDEIGRDAWDEPQHEVTLTHDFYVSVYEITQEQYLAYMGYNPSFHFGCDNCPVEDIDWAEAAAFANAVSSSAGLELCYLCTTDEGLECTSSPAFVNPYTCPGYRLPTEAEWEYAARAGEPNSFSNGGNLNVGDDVNCNGKLLLDNGTVLDDVAWYCGNTPDHTQEVGLLAANALGLYDMNGNAWEWTNDWYDDYPESAVTDPTGGSVFTFPVVRSGSYDAPPSRSRFANRANPAPSDPRDNRRMGIRLVRSIP